MKELNRRGFIKALGAASLGLFLARCNGGSDNQATRIVELEGQLTKKAADSAKELPATWTPRPENTRQPEATVTPEAVVPSEKITVGKWDIEYFQGATNEMKNWDFKNIDPKSWNIFPNVDNPTVDFRAKDGLEYGEDETLICEQDDRCDIVVPAMHYRIVTADYNMGFDQCQAGEVGANGCALMIVNVGEVSANFKDVKVDSGFTVSGRYWNGDKLPTAIWAGLSHTANNMLNLDSNLNPNGGVNAGANCSSPRGCEQVRAAFVIASGNEVLMKGITTVAK